MSVFDYIFNDKESIIFDFTESIDWKNEIKNDIIKTLDEHFWKVDIKRPWMLKHRTGEERDGLKSGINRKHYYAVRFRTIKVLTEKMLSKKQPSYHLSKVFSKISDSSLNNDEFMTFSEITSKRNINIIWNDCIAFPQKRTISHTLGIHSVVLRVKKIIGMPKDDGHRIRPVIILDDSHDEKIQSIIYNHSGIPVFPNINPHIHLPICDRRCFDRMVEKYKNIYKPKVCLKPFLYIDQ
jgi:hypothetical protein